MDVVATSLCGGSSATMYSFGVAGTFQFQDVLKGCHSSSFPGRPRHHCHLMSLQRSTSLVDGCAHRCGNGHCGLRTLVLMFLEPNIND